VSPYPLHSPCSPSSRSNEMRFACILANFHSSGPLAPFIVAARPRVEFSGSCTVSRSAPPLEGKGPTTSQYASGSNDGPNESACGWGADPAVVRLATVHVTTLLPTSRMSTRKTQRKVPDFCFWGLVAGRATEWPRPAGVAAPAATVPSLAVSGVSAAGVVRGGLLSEVPALSAAAVGAFDAGSTGDAAGALGAIPEMTSAACVGETAGVAIAELRLDGGTAVRREDARFSDGEGASGVAVGETACAEIEEPRRCGGTAAMREDARFSEGGGVSGVAVGETACAEIEEPRRCGGTAATREDARFSDGGASGAAVGETACDEIEEPRLDGAGTAGARPEPRLPAGDALGVDGTGGNGPAPGALDGGWIGT
jgi:hypothetical protein